MNTHSTDKERSFSTSGVKNIIKPLANNSPLLIVQVKLPQHTGRGDYFYRTHAPGIAMAQDNGIYVVNITNQHRKKDEIKMMADILISKNICDPDFLPMIRRRKVDSLPLNPPYM